MYSGDRSGITHRRDYLVGHGQQMRPLTSIIRMQSNRIFL